MTIVVMHSSHLLLLISCFLGAASLGTWEGEPLRASDDGGDSPSDLHSGGRDQDMVSQHMFKLYERYNRERRLKEGNTVRSFRANQEPSDHGAVYRLNLTSLQDTEAILSATFHFPHERRPHHKSWSCKRFKSPSCRPLAAHPSPSISLILRSVSLGSEVGPGPMGSLLGNMTFHPQRRGVWQMKDVTQVIKEARGRGHLWVSVEVDVGQRRPEDVRPGSSLPYLLLYADDGALAEPNSVAAGLQRYDPLGDGGEPELPREGGPSSDPRGRARREAAPLPDRVENNELPEVEYRPEGRRKEELWESTWYLALKPKHKADKNKRKSQEEEEAARWGGVSRDKEHAAVWDPQDAEAKRPKGARTPVADAAAAAADGTEHKRRSEGKDGKKHKGATNFQSPVLSFDEQTMRKARRRQWGGGHHRGCSRRNLRVDFADIGWSEWVIAPKAFDAYYCAGTCGFPIPKVLRPSNHATIQSIVRAVGIVSGVPEPCCVPEKMSPLAVLFQDDSRNPVLKIYPEMSVQSCSCR